MNGESLNIQQDNLEKLKQHFPELFSEGQIDIEKFNAAFTGNINFANERYVLNWAGKADAFKTLQVPTTATLKPVPEESVNFDTTQNVFIEGENLEVLKVLQKSYYNKIKCIIIDPPYNTGNDNFIYPDSFKENRADYEKRVGDKDEEGFLMKEGFFKKNSKDSGHYHSNWLSMMYPRLFLAKNLLKEDGVIFIHIDDNEVHNLRLLMNEIFGEENFIVQILWKKRSTPPNDQIIGANHDYILVFAKDKNQVKLNLRHRSEDQLNRYKNPDTHPKGPWTAGDLMANVKGGRYVSSLHFPIINPITKQEHYPSQNGNWRFNSKTIETLMANNEIYFGEDGKGRPKLKRFLSKVKEGVTYPSIWDFVPLNTMGSQEMLELLGNMNIFDNPKPSGLINEIVKLGAEKDSIVMDFFGGSGTTAQAVLELNKEDGGNRKFILVQLPELADTNREAYKAGYKTIAAISKERIRRVIKKMQAEITAEEKKKSGQLNLGDKNSIPQHLDLGFKAFKLSPSNFKIWRGNEITEENLTQQLDAFTNPVKESSREQNILYELMVKAGYELTDPVEVISFPVGEGRDGAFYSINNGELVIALTEMNQTVIDHILVAKPKKVITLDHLFAGNDQLKTNTVLQMRDAGVEFKTI